MIQLSELRNFNTIDSNGALTEQGILEIICAGGLVLII
jgi:hypothetical protein